MNKKLKFTRELSELILVGKKTSTWRLWDDKNLSEGETVDFIESETNEHFATAILIKIIQKPLGALTNKDKEGHESFRTDEEMYNTYQRYYNKHVGPETLIKIIHFKLIPIEQLST